MECSDGTVPLVKKDVLWKAENLSGQELELNYAVDTNEQPNLKTESRSEDVSIAFMSTRDGSVSHKETVYEPAGHSNTSDEMVVTSTDDNHESKPPVPTGLLLYHLFNQIIIDALLNTNGEAATEMARKNTCTRNRKNVNSGYSSSVNKNEVDVFNTTQEWVNRHYLIFKNNTGDENTDEVVTNHCDIAVTDLIGSECIDNRIEDGGPVKLCDNVSENGFVRLGGEQRHSCVTGETNCASDAHSSFTEDVMKIDVPGDCKINETIIVNDLSGRQYDGGGESDENVMAVQCFSNASYNETVIRKESVIINMANSIVKRDNSYISDVDQDKVVIVDTVNKKYSINNRSVDIITSDNFVDRKEVYATSDNGVVNFTDKMAHSSVVVVRPFAKSEPIVKPEPSDTIVKKIICERFNQFELLQGSSNMDIMAGEVRINGMEQDNTIRDKYPNNSNENSDLNLFVDIDDLSITTENSFDNSDTLSGNTVLNMCEEDLSVQSAESVDFIKPERPIMDEKIINDTFEWFKKRLLETINSEIRNSNDVNSSDVVLDRIMNSTMYKDLVSHHINRNDNVNDVITNLTVKNSNDNIITNQYCIDNTTMNDAMVQKVKVERFNIDEYPFCEKIEPILNVQDSSGNDTDSSSTISAISCRRNETFGHEHLSKRMKFEDGINGIDSGKYKTNASQECDFTGWDHSYSVNDERRRRYSCKNCNTSRKFNYDSSSYSKRKVNNAGTNESSYLSAGEEFVKVLDLDNGVLISTRMIGSDGLDVEGSHIERTFVKKYITSGGGRDECSSSGVNDVNYDLNEFDIENNNGCDGVDNCSTITAYSGRSVGSDNLVNCCLNNKKIKLDTDRVLEVSEVCVSPADEIRPGKCLPCRKRNFKGEFNQCTCDSLYTEVNNNKIKNCSVVVSRVNLVDGLQCYACKCGCVFYDSTQCSQHKNYCRYDKIGTCNSDLCSSDNNISSNSNDSKQIIHSDVVINRSISDVGTN